MVPEQIAGRVELDGSDSMSSVVRFTHGEMAEGAHAFARQPLVEQEAVEGAVLARPRHAGDRMMEAQLTQSPARSVPRTVHPRAYGCHRKSRCSAEMVGVE